MRTTTMAVACALLGLLAACATQSYEQKIIAEGGKRMTEAELRQMLSQKITLEFLSEPGASSWFHGTTVFSPNGTLVQEVRAASTEELKQYGESNINAVNTTGDWTIEGDLLCIKYQNREKSCNKRYKVSDKIYYGLSPDGRQAFKSEVKD